MKRLSTIDDVKKIQKNLNRFMRTIDVVPTEIITEEIPRIYAEEIAMTPYQSGTLQESVYCKLSKDSNKSRNLGILTGASVTGTGYDYAVIEHENEEYEHPIKGQAHFISIPFAKGVERITRTMKARLKYQK